MTAYALISGVIFRAPVQKISKAGKPFTTCTVKSGSDDSGGGDFWNVLSFSESSQLELLRLEVGDAVSVRGKMKLEIFEKDGQARISRSVFADAALGLRPAPRTQKPKAPPAGSKAADAIVKQSILPDATPAKETAAGGPAFFDDDIPFEAAR
jgi:single-stranded DNA-binding protein